MIELDNDKIERIAARKVEEIVDDSIILKTFINRGDKDPFWDGSIFVYNDTSNKNLNFRGKIPIQIKGTIVKEFSGDTRKYPIRVSDLESYLKDGGAIFFVVEIINSSVTAIYYASLFPLVIDDLLSNKKEGQKTISTELIALDVTNIKEIEIICHEFLFHRERQYSTIKNRLSIKDIYNLESISFTIFGSERHLYKYVIQDYVVLYGQRQGDSLQLPISKVKFQSIKYTMDRKISINSRIYFSEYKVEKMAKSDVIILGENIKVYQGKISYKFKGNLNTRLKELEFLRDVYQTGHFYIGKHKINGVKSTKEVKRRIDIYYKHLIEIKNLMEYFNVKDDLELDLLTEEELSILQMLTNIILYNRSTGYEFLESGPMYVQLGSIKIAVFVNRKNDGKLEINDFFDYGKRVECKLVAEDEGINERGSIFTMLKAEDIIKLSNLDLDKLVNSIKSIPFSEAYSTQVTLLVLELIKSYDMKNDLTDCLSIAIDLCEWLEGYGSESEIYKMNKLQAIKRIRDLSIKEKQELIKIREAHEDDFLILCGVSILLENKFDFEYYFDKMDEDDQSEFKRYPIYRLVKAF